jgi:hypothetical protein
MNKTYSLDGVQAILSYPFKLPGWQSKFAIGVVLFFANYIIPIIPGIFIAGYFARIMRPVIVDEAEPVLPAWEDWGDLFKRGLRLSCASLIYLFPAIFLLVVGYLIIYVPLFMNIVSSSGRYGIDSTSRNMFGMNTIGMFAGLGMIFLGFILYVPLAFMLPPALAHLIAKDSFAAAFRVREWGAILRANFWGFFTALAVTIGIYTILFMAVYMLYFTIILCFLMPIGMGIIIFYLSVISAPMLGEAYRKGVENMAVAADVV